MIYVLSLTPCLDRTALCSRFDTEKTNRIRPLRSDLGGKGVNCARTLKALGADVTLCGADFEGRVHRELAGQFPLLLRETGLPLRCNLKIFDQSRKKTVEINEPATPLPEALMREILTALKEKLCPGDVLTLCGSLPGQADPGTYALFCRAAAEKGALTAADVSGNALLPVTEAAPALIKPNREEFAALLRELTGSEPEKDPECLIRAGQRLCLEKGIGRILLSLGKDGALLITEKEGLFCEAPPVNVRGDIGAGDAMTAAAALCLSRKDPDPVLLRTASAAAGAVLEKEGTQPPDPEEIRRILALLH